MKTTSVSQFVHVNVLRVGDLVIEEITGGLGGHELNSLAIEEYQRDVCPLVGQTFIRPLQVDLWYGHRA